MFPYVLFDSPLSRGSVLRMVVAPFVGLSLLPLLVLPFLHGTAWGLVLAFCSLHAAMCGGDAVVAWQLVAQVPRAGLVHNNGWQTYWHLPVEKIAGQGDVVNNGPEQGGCC